MSGVTLAATLLAPINTFADDYLGEIGDPGAAEKSYEDQVADYWTKRIAEEEKAEKEANNFVSRFGDNHAKRHCKTIGQYRQNGAYSTNWTPR